MIISALDFDGTNMGFQIHKKDIGDFVVFYSGRMGAAHFGRTST